jgi:hypothetical protein
MLEFFPKFQKEEIDMNLLEQMNDNQLEKLGMKMQARIKLMTAVKERKINKGQYFLFCFEFVLLLCLHNSFLFSY